MMEKIFTAYSTNDHDTMQTQENFADLIQVAQNALVAPFESSHSCVLVLRTAKNNIYHCVITNGCSNYENEEKAFLDNLRQNDDLEVSQMVCMWHDGSLDISSFTFRDMLCKLHENNKNAEMILTGENCYHKKTIAETFPRSYRDKF